ncbi:MAG: hypothetical protein R3E74_04000 [Pseudomonadales bacterium]
MKQLKSYLSCVLMLLFSANLSYAESSKDAFINIKKSALKKEYHHLAVAPLDAAADLKMPDSVKSMLEQEVVKRLKKEGFKVLSPQIMQDIRQQMNSLVGLAHQAGEEDPKKLAAVLDHSYRELLLRHKVDGIVSLRVRAVGAPFMNDKAEWDGASQKIAHKGDGLMKFITGKSYGGTIAASTLKVSIWDRRETLLYSWGGGIEVLMQRNAKTLEQIPTSEFWQDEKRIKNSAKLALSPL